VIVPHGVSPKINSLDVLGLCHRQRDAHDPACKTDLGRGRTVGRREVARSLEKSRGGSMPERCPQAARRQRYLSPVELADRRTNGFGVRNAEFFIDFKCLSAELIGMAAFSGIAGDAAQAPLRVGFTASITEVSGKGQGLTVILVGLVILADMPLNVAQPPQCHGFAVPITEVSDEGQGLTLVVAGLVILADVVRYVAQPPQRVGFSALVTKVSGESQGLTVVVAGLVILADEVLYVA
jgi:hypothetical protein